jgi:hypothetical protein
VLRRRGRHGYDAELILADRSIERLRTDALQVLSSEARPSWAVRHLRRGRRNSAQPPSNRNTAKNKTVRKSGLVGSITAGTS